MNILRIAARSAMALGAGAVLGLPALAAAPVETVPARPAAEKAAKPTAIAPAGKPATRSTVPAKGTLPDLTVAADSLRAIPDPALAGAAEVGDARFEAEVRNAGGTEARNFTVVFSLLKEGVPFQELGRATVASLAAGSSTRVSVAKKANFLPPAGAYRLKVAADIHPTSVAESDERNNSADKPITIIGPDFAVSGSDIELTPDPPRAGEPFSVRAVIRNHGSGRGLLDAHVSLVDASGRVLADDPKWIEIPAGGFRYVESRFTLPAGYGDYAVRVEADTRGRNPEVNEGDNRGERYISIRSR